MLNMTDEFQTAVDEALALIAQYKVNPPDLTDKFSEGYAAALDMAGVQLGEIHPAAMRLVLNSQEFFPKSPGTFFDEVRCIRRGLAPGEDTSKEVLVERAWQAVRSCIRRFGVAASWDAEDLGRDGAALYAADAMGIPELGTMTSENRNIKRKEFERLYLESVDARRFQQHYAGSIERSNTGLGIPIDRPSLMGRSDYAPCAALPAYAPPSALEGRAPSQLPERVGGGDESPAASHARYVVAKRKLEGGVSASR